MGTAHFFIPRTFRVCEVKRAVKSDLLLAVTQLAAERSLPHEVVISALEAALASAYKRDPAAGGQDVTVELDHENGDVNVRTGLMVVDEIEEPGMQVTLEDAQKKSPDAKLGDFIVTGSFEGSLGRIAAQTAKQIVMQRLREAERDIVFGEYADKIGEVFTGTIQRIEPRYVTVDLGKADAIMPPEEQVPAERYRPGHQLKFYFLNLTRTERGPELILSRSHIELLRRLFEMEVPEIFSGVVEIMSMAREPGARSKIAVRSNQQGIDAVGACVGLRGLRIQNVVNELVGEKIDVIEWSDEAVEFIANSLSPAAVDEVVLDEEARTAKVVVHDRVLSLAIGRDGQNARLASKLTNWGIDIQAASVVAGVGLVEEQDEPTVDVEKDQPVQGSVVGDSDVGDKDSQDIGFKEESQKLATDGEGAVTKPAVVAADDSADIAETEAPIGDLESVDDKVAESDSEEAALKALEEELAALEREEAERRLAEEQATPVSMEISSDDIWTVQSRPKKETESTLRFAEDIAGFRDVGDDRKRGKGGRKGSPKGRRAAARKQRR